MVTVAVLGTVLATVLVWRLSQGPLELSWLVARIEQVINAPENPTRFSVGGAALTWDGFQHGLDRPLDLRLTDIAVSDQNGRRRIHIPSADVSLYFRYLMLLEIVPRAIEIDGAALTMIRSADGTISLDMGSLTETADGMTAPLIARPAGPTLPELLRELADPLGNGGPRAFYSHLQVLRVSKAAITILDHRQQTTWNVTQAEVHLNRRPQGGIEGSAMLELALGGERATLTATGTVDPADGGARVSLQMSPLTPATLARAAPGLAVLAGLDAPVRINADLSVDAELKPLSGAMRVDVGAGHLWIGQDAIPLANAGVTLSARPDTVTIDTLRLSVLGRPDGAPTAVRASGTVRRAADSVSASLTLGFDQVLFADLPNLWPKGVGTDTRDWLLENITTGVARNGKVQLEVRGRSDLSRIEVTRVSGGVDGEDLTVHWLRPVLPIERGRARLNFLDHDNLEIILASARQRGGARGGYLTATSGRMVITGLSVKDQFAAIDADVVGSVPAAIGLLREPRLGLLEKQKIDFKEPAGDATFKLAIRFPLEKDLKIEELSVKVNAQLSKLRLAGMVAGRDIDQGEIELEAINTGLTIKGRAQLAAIPVQLEGMMDFRDGAATQVQRRISINGRASARQLAAAGLDGEDWLDGDVSGSATWTERRNGTADVTFDADLTQAILSVPPAAWQKPAGAPARGSGRLMLVKDQMRVIEQVRLDGDGASFRGTIDAADGRIAGIRIDRATFGRSDVRGTIRFPPGQPVLVNLTGPALDVGDKIRQKEPKSPRLAPNAPPAGSWTLESRFDQVFLAHGRTASNVNATGRFDGRIYAALSVQGRLAADKSFRLDITGPRGQRRLGVAADDAGALLLGLDLVKSMQGGVLDVSGTFDDSRAGYPLTGSAKINDFRVRGSVGLAKLLQAMTLYGLVDVLRGPGIGFSELIAPFRMDDTQITLDNARAFSSSLGITAKGNLFPHDDRVDMEGTIVPAYFFNSLLGSIPLVGRLFSPETGGGLFAARYTLRGPLDDPSVFVNPLSALTPGFLREIFGIF